MNNDENQTPNMEKLKAASRALDALEKQRRDEIFGLLLCTRLVCLSLLLFLRILALIMLMKLKKCGHN
ncbi:MAG: hypothetical protein ACLTZT_11175 [Butyricimonas faecalis]